MQICLLWKKKRDLHAPYLKSILFIFYLYFHFKHNNVCCNLKNGHFTRNIVYILCDLWQNFVQNNIW